MAAVLIKDQTGTDIVFFDNGTEVHKASGRMIRITNQLIGAVNPRKFEYKTDEEFETAWNTWVSICANKPKEEVKKPESSKPKKEVKKETDKEAKKPEQVSIDEL